MVTSGIRLGSPAFTTRGFKEAEARMVGNFIADVLDAPNDEAVIARVRGSRGALCAVSRVSVELFCGRAAATFTFDFVALWSWRHLIATITLSPDFNLCNSPTGFRTAFATRTVGGRWSFNRT